MLIYFIVSCCRALRRYVADSLTLSPILKHSPTETTVQTQTHPRSLSVTERFNWSHIPYRSNSLSFAFPLRCFRLHNRGTLTKEQQCSLVRNLKYKDLKYSFAICHLDALICILTFWEIVLSSFWERCKDGYVYMSKENDGSLGHANL